MLEEEQLPSNLIVFLLRYVIQGTSVHNEQVYFPASDKWAAPAASKCRVTRVLYALTQALLDNHSRSKNDLAYILVQLTALFNQSSDAATYMDTEYGQNSSACCACSNCGMTKEKD